MSLVCHPLLGGSTQSSLSFFLSPDSSSPSLHSEVQVDDYLLCTEREGSWFHCHTRLASGWISGIHLLPVQFPSVFIVNDELPSDAQIRLRFKPSDLDSVISSTIFPGTLLYVLEIKDNWLRINYNGKEVWLKRVVNDMILAIPVIPKIYEKGPTLPSGCSLRLRDAPRDDGTITRLSQNDFFLGVQSLGNWIQVIGHPRTLNSFSSPEWMLRKAPDGTILLQESKQKIKLMCIEQDIPQEAVLCIREVPEAEGSEVSQVTYWDILPVCHIEGVWASTLTDVWDGFVLTMSGSKKLLQPYVPIYPKSTNASSSVPTQPVAPKIPIPSNLNLPETTSPALPLEVAKPNLFDDQPLPSKGLSKIFPEDERPLSSNKPLSFDDQPISGTKSKPNVFDEQPLPSQASKAPQIEDNSKLTLTERGHSFDEKSLSVQSTNKPNLDEQPLPTPSLPKQQNEDERPLNVNRRSSFDEKPLPTQSATKSQTTEQMSPTQGAREPQVVDDERPLTGAKKSSFDEKPLPMKKLNSFDEQPLPVQQPSNIQTEDERPLTGSQFSASKDLAEENEIKGEFQTNASTKPVLGSNKTKKGPPARLLAKKTTETSQSATNNENVPNGNLEKPSAKPEMKPKPEPLQSLSATVDVRVASEPVTIQGNEKEEIDDRPHGKILDLLNSYTTDDQINGLRLFVGTISTLNKGIGGNISSASEAFSLLVHGLCSCLQENEVRVKEEAIKSLHDIQEISSKSSNGIINGAAAATLVGILIGKLFVMKFTEDTFWKQVQTCTSRLIQDYPSDTIHVMTNGLVSKNLHCVLNTVQLVQDLVGKKINQSQFPDGERNAQIKAIAHNLLIVVSTSKPKMKSISLKILQNMISIWPIDLKSYLQGEDEEIDSTLLEGPQVQELVNSLEGPLGKSPNISKAAIKPALATSLPPAIEVLPESEPRFEPPSDQNLPPPSVTNSPPLRPMKSNAWLEANEESHPEYTYQKKQTTPKTAPQISPRQQNKIKISSDSSIHQSLSGNQPLQSKSPRESRDDELFRIFTECLENEEVEMTTHFSPMKSKSNHKIELLGGCEDDLRAIDQQLLNQSQKRQNVNYSLHFKQLNEQTTTKTNFELLNLLQNDLQEIRLTHLKEIEEIFALERTNDFIDGMTLQKLDSFDRQEYSFP